MRASRWMAPESWVKGISPRGERGDRAVCLRGGSWNNGSNAGVWAVNLNNARSNVNTNVGFRPFQAGVGRVVLMGTAPARCLNESWSLPNREGQ